ncbi:MAG: S1C family serine protease [Chitinophagales bacterium]
MIKKVYPIVGLLLCCLLSFAQGKQPSATQMKFPDFLSGVKYAYIEFGEKDQQRIDQQDGGILIDHFKSYLQGIGFEEISATTIEKEAMLSKIPSLCEMAKVRLSFKPAKGYFTDHFLEFYSCLGHTFTFTSPAVVNNDAELLANLGGVWNQMYGQGMGYEERFRLSLPTRATNFTEQNIEMLFSKRAVDDLEGIYEKVMLGVPNRNKYKIGIVRNPSNNYEIVYLGGASNFKDWKKGEQLGKIYPTGTTNFYKVSWYHPNKDMDENVYLAMDGKNMLHLSFASDDDNIYKYLKLSPKSDLIPTKKREMISSGSSVAISPDGYLVTNYHVVEGGNTIEVQIKQNGYTKTYQAVLMISDEVNDLAVLKINDPSFKELPSISFSLRTSLSEVGEKIFTLGFPLTSTMGTDVKLTDGIISSKTGYKGDVSTYQVSAPVQPGSSGGPLFDMEGNLVGIIKAKHSKAENATYAVKSRNVLNLIELLPNKVVLPQMGDLKGMSLQDQVKDLQRFVFWVKVY